MNSPKQTLVINNNASLEIIDSQIVVTIKDKKEYIPINNLDLIIFSTNKEIKLSSLVLEKLISNNIMTLFLDKKEKPYFICENLYSTFDKTAKIQNQINWSSNIKSNIFITIIKNKVVNQNKLLDRLNFK